MPLSDVSGLSIYRKTNPYERRAAVGMQMMKQSGYAAPLVAGMTGQSMAQAEQWDTDQEQKGLALLQQQRRAQMAQAEFKNVLDLSKTDAPAATQLLAAITKQYPELQPFSGIKFTNETSEKGWMQVEDANGNKYQVHAPTYFSKMQAGDVEGAKKAVINLGDVGIAGDKRKHEKEIEIGVDDERVQKAVYDPKSPEADAQGYVRIGKPYLKHAKSIAPHGGAGSPQLKATQLTNIRRHMTDRILPFVPDVKLEDQEVGGEAAFSRVRAALKDSKLQAVADDMYEEVTADVQKGMSEIAATNKAWKKYGPTFENRPKAVPPKSEKRAEGPGLGEQIVEGVKGLFKGAGGNNEPPPPNVLADMKPGTQREFANGQVWQKDAQGNVSRIY